MSPAKKRVSTANKSERAVTTEERVSMVAEAAYYKAEHRGFSDGNPEHDWWEAEREIDAMLAASRGRGDGRRARTPGEQGR
jgi:hypothetical protein